jgi:hypothetical protein
MSYRFMEKYLLLLREDPTRHPAGNPAEWLANTKVVLEWIQSLTVAGNYCGGAPLDTAGRCVAKEKWMEEQSDGDAWGGILGYDIILAENIHQAAAIAQTRPLVVYGIAVREVRPILPMEL